MKVLFWGTPAFSLPALRALGEEGHDVVGVVTQPDRPAGRGRSISASPVKKAAREELIPVLQPERPWGDDFMDSMRVLQPDISVVVAYGQILRPEVLAVPPLGSINIHGSLLPELRGAAPVQWAIIRALEHSGVTIMQMEAGLDSGPILHQVVEPIRADETGRELGLRLSEIGAEALVEALALMEADSLTARPQDHSLATYAPKLDRATARIDWGRPAVEVARWIRALDDVPGSWSTRGDEMPVKLFDPRVEIRTGSPGLVLETDAEVGVLIACREYAVRIREVQPAGKRRMSAGEWVRGRGISEGDRFV
jgi:methionyl-tRNA formyltransferase